MSKRTIAFIIIGWIIGAFSMSVYMESAQDQAGLKRYLASHFACESTGKCDWGYCTAHPKETRDKVRIIPDCNFAIVSSRGEWQQEEPNDTKACSSGQIDKCDWDYCIAHPKKEMKQ